MSLALWCLLVAGLLPALSVFPAKISGDYDNSRPRDADFWRSGFRARARGAMDNGFEAFPFFAAAVLVAITQGGDQAVADALAAGWILLRLGYVAAYWTDRATLRSVIWAAALATAIALFLTPIWAAGGPA